MKPDQKRIYQNGADFIKASETKAVVQSAYFTFTPLLLRSIRIFGQ
jgi:hypothetical protein